MHVGYGEKFCRGIKIRDQTSLYHSGYREYWRGRVPYHRYVECQLKLPQMEKFDLHVLMLVLGDSPYGMRVPVQIGSLHIDMAIDLATEAEMQKLSHKWERAKMAHLLHIGSMTINENSDKSEFNLDEIQGSVHLTKNVTLGPFENVMISGLLKGPVESSLYYKHVNVSVEPLEVHKGDGAKYCVVAGYTFLKPGSHRIHVMIKNLTVRSIIVNQGSCQCDTSYAGSTGFGPN